MSYPRRAVILAAGQGSRLRPHTNNLPKSLLSVGNRTIFDRIILEIKKVGIKEVVVVTGYASSALESHISGYTKKLSENKLKFKIIRNDNLDIGNIYSFWLARAEMTEDFILFNSDVVFHPRILELLVYDKNDSVLVIDDVKQLVGGEEMMVKITDDHIVKDISKTLVPSQAQGEYVGIMKVSSEEAGKVLRKMDKLLAERKFPLYYEEALRLLAKEEDCLFACSTRSLPWTEVDDAEDLEYARHTILLQTKKFNEAFRKSAIE